MKTKHKVIDHKKTVIEIAERENISPDIAMFFFYLGISQTYDILMFADDLDIDLSKQIKKGKEQLEKLNKIKALEQQLAELKQ